MPLKGPQERNFSTTTALNEQGEALQLPEVTTQNFGDLYVITAECSLEAYQSGKVDLSRPHLMSMSGAIEDFERMGWMRDGQTSIVSNAFPVFLDDDRLRLVLTVRPDAPRRSAELSGPLVDRIREQTTAGMLRLVENQGIGSVTLDQASSIELIEALFELPGGVYDHSLAKRRDFLDALEQKVMPLLRGSSLQTALEALRVGKANALVIDGLPVDPVLPPTPSDGMPPVQKGTFVSEGLALAIAKKLGFPSLMMGEQKEAVVHQIAPTPAGAQTQSNAGVVALKFHQDTAPKAEMPGVEYSDFMADFLVLIGLRENTVKPTVTYLSLVWKVVCVLDPVHLLVLMEERFVTDPPESFQREGMSAEGAPRHAILSVLPHQQRIESAFDISSGTRPVDPEDHAAQAALDAFHAAVERVKEAVEIKPGTAVAFRNREVLHARGPIEGTNFEGDERRWLQRVFAYDPLRVFEQIENLRGQSMSIILKACPGLLAVFPEMKVSDRIGELDDL